MILVTTAANDADLAPAFPAKYDATPANIPYGDAAFFGKWKHGQDALFAFERKKVPGLVQDINTGRHLDQVRRTNDAGWPVVQFLIIEGGYRRGEYDKLVYSDSRGTWREVEGDMRFGRFQSYLDQCDLYLGLRVVVTDGLASTVRQIARIYDLTRKPYWEHKSLQRFYERPEPGLTFIRPTFLRRLLKELDHVDWVRSASLEAAFPTPEALFNATVEDLDDVEGIGPVIAQSIWKQLHEGG